MELYGYFLVLQYGEVRFNITSPYDLDTVVAVEGSPVQGIDPIIAKPLLTTPEVMDFGGMITGSLSYQTKLSNEANHVCILAAFWWGICFS